MKKMRIDKKWRDRAEKNQEPMFRVEIDWRFVPPEMRPIGSFRAEGVLSLHFASALMNAALENGKSLKEGER